MPSKAMPITTRSRSKSKSPAPSKTSSPSKSKKAPASSSASAQKSNDKRNGAKNNKESSFSIRDAVGLVNIAYITCAAALGWFVDYRLFVAATSWVHYIKYIHQYYYRGAARNQKLYKAWQRDVLLYKSIALLNLAYLYLRPLYDTATATFEFEKLDKVSVAMVAVVYFISVSATKALGVNGTCTFVELNP